MDYFKDIIGQDELKKRLIETANSGIVPHAQLFTEPGGAGAFNLAFAYARYLNCTNRTETDACGCCPSCLKYDIAAHPDLYFTFPIISRKEKKLETCDQYLPLWRDFLQNNEYFNLNTWLDFIDAGNSQALIYSKESDEIIKKMSLKIHEANFRILIVWMPERLHPTCANKLLKIIEEPPTNSVILMVSETPDSILGTIQSRAQRINIRPIEKESICNALVTRFNLEKEAADTVAHIANGNYLKAIETISLNEENKLFLDLFKSIMRNSWTKNVKEMKLLAENIASMGREKQKNFLQYCQRYIRENFIFALKDPNLNYLNRDEAGFSIKFSPYVNERNVVDFMNELSLAEMHISQNVNSKMVFFDLFLHITVLLKK